MTSILTSAINMTFIYADRCGIVGFNVPLDTVYDISETGIYADE